MARNVAANVNGRARMSWLSATVLFLGLVAACATTRFVPAVHANDSPGEAPRGAVQTRDGVTVRIEKVSLDRILSGPGWLRNVFGPDWQKYVPKGFRSDSFRVARVFVSVNGGGKGSSSFDFGKGQPRITQMSGTAQFDPNVWQRQLLDIEVDKAAKGYLFWAVIEDDAAIDAVFPATVTLEVDTGVGKKTKFVFDDLGLKSSQ